MRPTSWEHRFVEVAGIDARRLMDADGLAVAVVAAAGAMGLTAEGAPVVRGVRSGDSVAHLCREGHIVLRALPDEGRCLVDVLCESGVALQRGLDVLGRRLGVAF